MQTSGWCGDDTSMLSYDKPTGLQLIQVATDRHCGNTELRRQVSDPSATWLPGRLDDRFLTIRTLHMGVLSRILPAVLAKLSPRAASTVMFFTNGALAGNLLPRLPEVKDVFTMSNTLFGFIVIAMPIGALSAAHSPAWFMRRYGDRRVVLAGTALASILLTIAGASMSVSSSWAVWLFAAAIATFGLADAVVDTAQNAQGLAVQRALGKPILMTMHAGWSVGGATGAAVGSLAARQHVAPSLHFTVIGVALTALVALAARSFVPAQPDTSDEASGTASTGKALVLLATPIFIALAGFAVEEVGNSWAALFLRVERHFDVGAAGLGTSALLGSQFIGRLAGDHVLARLGRAATVRSGMALVLCGLIMLVTSGVFPPLAYGGLALAGLGSAVTVPVAFAIADEMPGLPPHSGLALVGWIMRCSAVIASPVTGIIAGTAGLTVGMLVFVAIAAAGMLAALRV